MVRKLNVIGIGPQAQDRAEVPATGGRAPARILVAALACLVAAGGLLWWQRGAAVFGDLIVAGLAWCF